MSDRQIQIANFKYGLDTRREVLVSQPGVLEVCENAHINSGGEIEKRKAFVPDATLFPENTFGLQDTDEGLMTFCSSTFIGDLPTGVRSQRLPHPTSFITGTTDTPAMTRVLFSCNHNGKAFVIAEFADGNRFLYYDGQLVSQSRFGLVLTDVSGVENLADLSGDLVDAIDAIDGGWSALSNRNALTVADQAGFVQAGATLVRSPAGVHFTPTTVDTSVSGSMLTKRIDQDYPGVVAKAASAAFTLNAGTAGTVTVTAPATADGAGTAALTNGAVSFDTNLATTAAAVAAAINNNSYVTGYSAVVSSAIVTVYAPETWGAITFDVTVTTTGSITTTAGIVSSSFVATLDPPNVDVTSARGVRDKLISVSGACTVSTKGAANVVSFLWSETNKDGTPVTVPSGIKMSLTTSAKVNFSTFLTYGQTVLGYFQCVATDSGGALGSPATIRLYVKLRRR